MKVDIVGNMCTWTQELSTSYIIDDKIMFDIPQGSFKTIYNKYNITKIDYIIISHFHSDHFMDIHLVLDILCHYCDKKDITIIAPKGCRERIIEMLKIVEVKYIEAYMNEHVTFIDCENGKTIKLGEYKIKTYKMIHKDLDAYGFIIENEQHEKIGFSGDSCMCNSLHKILRHCNSIFIDCASTTANNKHLSVDEVIELSKEYDQVNFYPVHFSYNALIYLKEKINESNKNIFITHQGQVIEAN